MSKVEENMSTNAGGAGEYSTPHAARPKKSKDETSPTGFESSPKNNMYTKTMKFKIVDPKDRINSKDLWSPKKGQPKFDSFPQSKKVYTEARYSKFKNETSRRTPQEQLHKAVKQIQMKMDEVNKLVDFTSKMKQELKEDDTGLKQLKRTKNSITRIQEKIQHISNKIKTLIE